MAISVESIETQIPYYLTQEQKENLTKALLDFPENINYYTQIYPDEILQGDGWSRFEIIKFENGERKEIKGIVLSNSCDISPDNPRYFPPKITFAPIIKLNNYAELLRANGVENSKIENRLKTIREQRITNLFFLPSNSVLHDDHIALLDDLYTMPFNTFISKPERSKQFTLSQVGFYLFLLKLSVHFCRFREEIIRDSE
jgi:hypothetical protein